jgi:peptide/nickel transport system ATP-binding protein
VFERPRHQYTRALIRSIPDLDLPPHTILETIEGQPPSLLHAPTSCRFATRCPSVQDRCRIEVPERTTEGDHSFSCWYPVESVPVEVGDGR